MFDFLMLCLLISSFVVLWRNHQSRVRHNLVLDELAAEIARLRQLITRQQSLDLVDAAAGEQEGFLEAHYGGEQPEQTH